MNRQRDAFVEVPHSKQIVSRLNQAVRNCEILPIIGSPGSGKDRFLDWWWQVACHDSKLSSGNVVHSEDIVCIQAQTVPSKSVPMTSVIFTKLLAALGDLELALSQHRQPRRPDRIRTWITDRQVLSLIYEHVHPLFEQLQPQAVVITNAHLLDKQTIELLLELRRPTRRGYSLIPRCALILCAQTPLGNDTDSQWSKLLNTISETRAAWPNHLQYNTLTVNEFGIVMLTIVEENLNAKFASGLDPQTTLQLFGKWTHANWWLIEQLIIKLDTALGSMQQGKPRLVTQAVVEQVQKVWLERSQ